MAIVTGEVTPTPGREKPFRVVITMGSEILAEWPVESEAEGERQIVTVLRGLKKLAEDEGYI